MLITRSLFVAALAFALALPQSTHAAGRPQADASATLAALAQRYYDAQARFDPVYSATLAGDNRFDDQLPLDIAPPLRKKRFAMYHQVQQQLAGVDRNRLSPADALTYDLLARDLRTRIGFEKFDEHLLPLLQTSAIPMLMANFGSGQAEQPLKTVAQYDAYLKRIGHLPAWADQATVNMREGIRRGVVQPKAVTAAALAQLRALGGERIEDSPFYAPLKNLPASFSDTDRQRLTAAYQDAVQKRIAPAMRRFAAFVEKEYLPASRDTAGWGALPNGAEWYRQCVRDQTTTDLSPEEIHAIGLKEVARIQAELAAVAPKLGYDGDPRQLLAWVRTNPKFLPFRSEAQILDAYRAINEKVKANLPQLFARMPKAGSTFGLSRN